MLVRVLHYYGRALRGEGEEFCIFDVGQDVLSLGIRDHVVVEAAVLYLVAEMEDFELILSCSLLVRCHLIIDGCHVLRSMLHAHLIWEMRSTELISHVGRHLRGHDRSRIWEWKPSGLRHRGLCHLLCHLARRIRMPAGSRQRILDMNRLQLLQRLDLAAKLVNALFERCLRPVGVAPEQVCSGLVIASVSA